MTANQSAVPSSETPLEPKRRRKHRSTTEPVVRDARKSRERWSNRRHKVQSWMIMLTAGMVVLAGLNSLVEILTGNRLIPNLYPILVGIALLGLLIWSFFRLVEFASEQRYSSLSNRSKNQRRERRERRKERYLEHNQSSGN